MQIPVDWPETLRPIDSVIPYLEGHGASAGVSIGGQERFVEGMAARWRYGFSFKLWSRDEHLAWRALKAQSTGRVGLIRVRVCDCRYAAKPVTAPSLSSTNIPYDDSMPHDDEAYYTQGGVDGFVTQNATAGSTEVVFSSEVALSIQPGQFFSDGARLYEIKSVDQLIGNSYRLRFAPRLRAALPAGTYISFSDLYCTMRISDENMLRAEISLGRRVVHQIDFVEALV